MPLIPRCVCSAMVTKIHIMLKQMGDTIMKLKYLAFLPALLLLASCDYPNQPNEVGLQEFFELKIGQTASIRGESLNITFNGVPQDSRCPEGVECIWTGNAVVDLGLLKGSEKGSLLLNTHVDPKQGDFLDYTVRLVDLKPLPSADKPVPEEQYRAVLVVSKR